MSDTMNDERCAASSGFEPAGVSGGGAGAPSVAGGRVALTALGCGTTRYRRPGM